MGQILNFPFSISSFNFSFQFPLFPIAPFLWHVCVHMWSIVIEAGAIVFAMCGMQCVIYGLHVQYNTAGLLYCFKHPMIG